MIVGCYTMHLYCGNPACKTMRHHEGSTFMIAAMGEFTGETAAACRRQARRWGWVFHGDEVWCSYACRAKSAT